jgi:hypothetical protein
MRFTSSRVWGVSKIPSEIGRTDGELLVAAHEFIDGK